MNVRDHIQHIVTGDIQFAMNKFSCALEACTYSGLGMFYKEIWIGNASLESQLQ